jgi:hypothetical protein
LSATSFGCGASWKKSDRHDVHRAVVILKERAQRSEPACPERSEGKDLVIAPGRDLDQVDRTRRIETSPRLDHEILRSSALRAISSG